LAKGLRSADKIYCYKFQTVTSPKLARNKHLKFHAHWHKYCLIVTNSFITYF